MWVKVCQVHMKKTVTNRTLGYCEIDSVCFFSSNDTWVITRSVRTTKTATDHIEPLDQQTVWFFTNACSVCTKKTRTTQTKPSDTQTVWIFSNVFPSVYQINKYWDSVVFHQWLVSMYQKKHSNKSKPHINRQCGFSAMCFPVYTR